MRDSWKCLLLGVAVFVGIVCFFARCQVVIGADKPKVDPAVAAAWAWSQPEPSGVIVHPAPVQEVRQPIPFPVDTQATIAPATFGTAASSFGAAVRLPPSAGTVRAGERIFTGRVLTVGRSGATSCST